LYRSALCDGDHAVDLSNLSEIRPGRRDVFD
jgi:hypothetical protein